MADPKDIPKPKPISGPINQHKALAMGQKPDVGGRPKPPK